MRVTSYSYILSMHLPIPLPLRLRKLVPVIRRRTYSILEESISVRSTALTFRCIRDSRSDIFRFYHDRFVILFFLCWTITATDNLNFIRTSTRLILFFFTLRRYTLIIHFDEVVRESNECPFLFLDRSRR